MDEMPIGPNGIARECEEKIARLLVEKETASKSARGEINRKIHRLRQLLAFCKTRAGYRS